MKLAFYFTLTCNARCDHCITEAGPQVKRTMTLAAASTLVDSAARVQGITGIVFTGGESFVHRRELLELVSQCTAAHLKSEVVTNGFWATNAATARQILAPFRAAGLGSIRLSIDRFHLPYIARERVHTALAALAEQGFLRHVTCVIDHVQDDVSQRPQSTVREILDPRSLAAWDEPYARHIVNELQRAWPQDLTALLSLYGFDLSTCVRLDDAIALRAVPFAGAKPLAEHIVRSRTLIQHQPLATEGRGRMLVSRVPDDHVDTMRDTACDSVIFTPTVTPEGDVFPCCSSWVNYKHQAIGNAHETAVDELLRRMALDPVALFMHYQGPAALLKYLRARGSTLVATGEDGRQFLRTIPSTRPPLPDRYTHPCHVCGTLLETYTRAELEEAISSYYEDQPWRVVVPVRGFDPAMIVDVAPV